VVQNGLLRRRRFSRRATFMILGFTHDNSRPLGLRYCAGAKNPPRLLTFTDSCRARISTFRHSPLRARLVDS
jgi:hypothetical protein